MRCTLNSINRYFFLLIKNLRILVMLLDSLDVYLRHTLSIMPWSKDGFQNLCWKLKKMPYLPLQNISKNDINVQKFNEYLTNKHCPISKFCSQKQETNCIPLVYAMKRWIDSTPDTLQSYHYGNLGLVTHSGVKVKLPSRLTKTRTFEYVSFEIASSS